MLPSLGVGAEWILLPERSFISVFPAVFGSCTDASDTGAYAEPAVEATDPLRQVIVSACGAYQSQPANSGCPSSHLTGTAGNPSGVRNSFSGPWKGSPHLRGGWRGPGLRDLRECGKLPAPMGFSLAAKTLQPLQMRILHSAGVVGWNLAADPAASFGRRREPRPCSCSIARSPGVPGLRWLGKQDLHPGWTRYSRCSPLGAAVSKAPILTCTILPK